MAEYGDFAWHNDNSCDLLIILKTSFENTECSWEVLDEVTGLTIHSPGFAILHIEQHFEPLEPRGPENK